MPCSLRICRMSFCLPFLSSQRVPQLSICGTKLTSAPKAKSSCSERLKMVSVTVMAWAPSDSHTIMNSRILFIVTFFLLKTAAKIHDSLQPVFHDCNKRMKSCNKDKEFAQDLACNYLHQELEGFSKLTNIELGDDKADGIKRAVSYIITKNYMDNYMVIICS